MPLSNSISLNNMGLLASLNKVVISPFDIINTLAPTLWLDATQIIGKNDGDSIDNFTDSSTNNRHFIGNGTNVTYKIDQNSNAIVRSSSGGLLTGPGTMSNYITASDFTVWIAGKIISAPNSGSPAYNNAAFIADGTGDAYFSVFVESDGHIGIYGYDGGVREVRTAIPIGTFFTCVIQHIGGQFKININGGIVTLASCGNIGNLSYTPHLFSNYNTTSTASLDIGEMGMCNKSFNASIIDSLSNYLIAKWAP